MVQDNSFCYEVALSYAGEDSDYVSQVAMHLRHLNVRLFFDKFEENNLWGKNLYTELDEVYRYKAICCVVFLSESYRRKLWTNHERQSIQARAFQERQEYILPVRLDNADIPGFLPTIAYLDGSQLKPVELAQKIKEKVILLRGTSQISESELPISEYKGPINGIRPLAMIYEPHWFGGGAYAVFDAGDRCRLAWMTSGFSGLNNFKGTACALMFDIEPRITLDWIKIDEIRVKVNAYRSLIQYEPLLPKPYETANVYYVEIDAEPGSSYVAEYRVDQGKRDIGFVRVYRGRPETVVIRINAKTPGIYNFGIELLVSSQNDRVLLPIIKDEKYLFDTKSSVSQSKHRTR
jgi:hypothetical protein